MGFFDTIISAGSNLVNTVAGPIMQLGGSYLQKQMSDDAATQAWTRQLYTGTHAIQDRVKDAIAAGVHPLFALGANAGYGSAPMSVGGDFQTPFKEMGQAVTKAADPMTDLLLQNQRLQNALLSADFERKQMDNSMTKESMLRMLSEGLSPDQGSFHYPEIPGQNVGTRGLTGGIGLPGASGYGGDPTGKVGSNEPLQADRLYNVRGVPVYAPIPVAMDFFTWWDNASNRARMGVLDLNKAINKGDPNWQKKFLQAVYGKGAVGGPFSIELNPFTPGYK